MKTNIKLLGITALVPGAETVTAVRLGMEANAITKGLEINRPGPGPIVSTNIEVDDNYTYSVTTHEAGTVTNKITHGNNTYIKIENFTYIIERFLHTHEKYGIEMSPVTLMIGDYVEKGHIISSAKKYNLRSANCLATILNYTEEDAMVISPKMAEDYGYKSIKKVEVPMAIGDYIELPEIGDKVETVKTYTPPASLRRGLEFVKRIAKPKHYVVNGTIVDIEVIGKNSTLKKYPDLNKIFTTRQEILKSVGLPHNPRFYRGKNNFPFKIIFTVVKTVPLQIRDKLSGRYGDKGIIVDIRDLGTVNGKPIDLIYSAMAPTNRNNPPVIMFGGLASMAREIRDEFRLELGIPIDTEHTDINPDEVSDKLSSEMIARFRNKCIKFNTIINSPDIDTYTNEYDEEDWRYELTRTIVEEFFVVIPFEESFSSRIFDLLKTEFALPTGKWIQPNGEVSEDDYTIAVRDIIVHDKIGTLSAVSLPIESQANIPKKVGMMKSRFLANYSPVRMFGNVETWIFSTMCDKEATSEFMALGKSSKDRRLVYNLFLEHGTKEIGKYTDRRENEFEYDYHGSLEKDFLQPTGSTFC